MAEKWIQKAVEHPGSFTKQVKAAGMSVQEFARKHRHSKGKIGRRARLALTLKRINT